MTAFDMYLNENGEYMQENEWDKLNTNRYDRILNDWKLVNTKLVMESISVNNRGNLFVVLNSRDTIEVFVTVQLIMNVGVYYYLILIRNI